MDLSWFWFQNVSAVWKSILVVLYDVVSSIYSVEMQNVQLVNIRNQLYCDVTVTNLDRFE